MRHQGVSSTLGFCWGLSPFLVDGHLLLVASHDLFSVHVCILMFSFIWTLSYIYSLWWTVYSNLLIIFYQVFFISVCFTALLKCDWYIANCTVGLPRWLSGKESDCQCRRLKRPGDSFPGLGRSPGEGHGHPLQYSCLENPMRRGTWQATVHGVTKSQTRLKQLSTHIHMTGI